MPMKLENFRLKVVVMSLFLIIYYLWIPPVLLMGEVYGANAFYGQYNFDNERYLLRFIASVVVILINCVAASLFLQANKSVGHEWYLRVNKVVSNITVFLMSIFSIPLIYNLIANGLSDRTASFEYMLLWRHHAVISAIFTIGLVSSLLSLLNGDRRNFIILFFCGVIPELVYGTRVSIFRIVFLLGVFLPWRFKYFVLLCGLLVLTGFSRSLFNEYSSSSLYDYLILFFGDPINITLGTSFLESNVNFECGVDGLHFVRSFLPPFLSLRDYFNEYLCDVTTCINENGFGVGAPNGLGGSPVNDMLVAPVSFFMSSLVLVVFVYFLFSAVANRNSIVRFYIPLIILSCAPYIMRNGMIPTSNHIITLILWVLIPMVAVVNAICASRWGSHNEREVSIL